MLGDKSVGHDTNIPVNAKEFGRCIRGHWVVESFHWHLDVTFREDANQTLEKRAAYNLNIINKIALSVLKITDLGMKPMSLKKKRYSISLDPLRFLKLVLSA